MRYRLRLSMKKLIFILAAMLTLGGLCACTGSPPGETQTPDGTQIQESDGNASTQTPAAEENIMYIKVGDIRLTATLEENAATAELKQRLKTAPITIEMADFGGWEKVGGFGFSLPTSDKQTTTKPCDFVLYQGNQLVIFYGTNSWSYTRLGKITGVTQEQLISILGSGDVTVTLSL